MKYRLETETVIHSDSDFATVAFLRINNARLDPKDTVTTNIAVPELLDEVFADVEKTLASSSRQPEQPEGLPHLDADQQSTTLEPSVRRDGNWLALANIQRTNTASGTSLSLEDEVRECFHTLQSDYRPHNFLGYLTNSD